MHSIIFHIDWQHFFLKFIIATDYILLFYLWIAFPEAHYRRLCIRMPNVAFISLELAEGISSLFFRFFFFFSIYFYKLDRSASLGAPQATVQLDDFNKYSKYNRLWVIACLTFIEIHRFVYERVCLSPRALERCTYPVFAIVDSSASAGDVFLILRYNAEQRVHL